MPQVTGFFPKDFWKGLLIDITENAALGPFSKFFIFCLTNALEKIGDYILDFTPAFGCLSLCSAMMEIGGMPPYMAFGQYVERDNHLKNQFRHYLASVSNFHNTTWAETQLEFFANFRLTLESLNEIKEKHTKLAEFDPPLIWQGFSQKPGLYFSAAAEQGPPAKKFKAGSR